MSHYAVAVIHRRDQDIDEMLAPFNENLAVEPYLRFTREQAIQYAKENWSSEYIDGKTDDEIYEDMADGYETDDAGNLYSNYNQNAKWDWYSIGGRWSGLLRLKGGGSADEARIRDVDFRSDPDEYRGAIHFWEVVVEGKKETEDDEHLFSLYNADYYRTFYGTKEKYAERMAMFSTRAVLTPGGEWHEPGKMGWWGLSSDTPESARDFFEHYRERFIDTADPDWIITIVDCHI